MFNKVQLHVGYVGITREGKRIEIIENRGSDIIYRWRDSYYEVYTDDGSFWLARGKDKRDIVGPWVEPVAEVPVPVFLLYSGYVGITRSGLKVTLGGKTKLNTTYPFTCIETGDSYTKHGFYYYSREETDMDIIGPWVEPVIQLHVGYVGITRSGLKVTLSRLSADKYPFKDLESGNSYSAEGYYWFDKHPSSFDIVGPWVDTPVAEAVDYNDGKWHRWSGGDCPVHLKSLVSITVLAHNGYPRTETRAADTVNWGPTCICPVVAFCVTKEYVETPKVPREFWISKLTNKAYLENPELPSYYTHVKEVI